MKKCLIFALGCFFSILLNAAPPPANEIFQVQSKLVDPNTFTLNWTIRAGFFLYADRIKITEAADSNVQVHVMRFPDALVKTDSQGKKFPIYRDNLSLSLAAMGTQPGETQVSVHYQGCADDGFCYPPQQRDIRLTINAKGELASAVLETDTNGVSSAPSLESKKEISFFANHHWPFVILSFFGMGLLLAFTPCVLPMVPVLSGIIVGHGENISTRKAFFLSLSYVLSMAATYAVVGGVIALLGNNLQIVMQSPWAISLFSLIFVILSLSMFGFYDLRLPLAWQAKLASVTRSQTSGHYLSAAIMGSLSTLILSPCVTAPLIGALSYIAHSGNVFIGVLALFFLGLGMGTPLLLIGTSAGKLLPKAGVWMNTVKYFFGTLLLAVAIYLLGRILPDLMEMLLWSGLLIFSGIFSGALNFATPQGKLQQGFGLILLVYGLLILIGASMGSRDPLMPLKPLVSESVASNRYKETRSAANLAQVQSILEEVKGKPVMIDFYADWCNSCKVMEATTFKNPKVLQAMKNIMTVKVDVTANSKENKALLQYYNVVAPPTFLFFDKEGKELKDMRIVGEAGAQSFLKHIEKIEAYN